MYYTYGRFELVPGVKTLFIYTVSLFNYSRDSNLRLIDIVLGMGLHGLKGSGSNRP